MARKKQVAYPLQLLAVASLEALYQPKVALYQLGNIPFGATRTLKKQWAKGAVASAKVRRGGGGSGVGPHRPPLGESAYYSAEADDRITSIGSLVTREVGQLASNTDNRDKCP